MSYKTTRTVTYEYTVYEPGDRVVSASARCSLVPGKVYVVKSFYPPPDCQQHGVVYLTDGKWGVGAEHIKEVEANHD